MADEQEVVSEQSSAPEADSGLERAQESFERVAERAGVDVGTEAERPSRAVRTREEEPPTAAEQILDGDKATESFISRRDARRQRNMMEAWARIAEHQARQPDPAAPAPASAAAPDDPEPDREEDFWGWSEWRDRQLQKGILSSLDERLRPLLSMAEERQREAQERAENDRAARERRAWFQEQREIAGDAHEAYAQTQEGQGYMDRIMWHIGDPGHPGDPTRGIPAREGRDSALSLGFEAALGVTPQEGRELAVRHLYGMQELARARGINPAVAMDRFTRVQLAAAMSFAQPGQGGGPSAGFVDPASSAPERRPAQSRVAALKSVAAAAGPVAGTVTEKTADPGGKDMAQLARADRLGPDDLRRLAKQKYGSDSRQNMTKLAKDLREKANELRATG